MANKDIWVPGNPSIIVYNLQLELGQNSKMLYKITDNYQVIVNNFSFKTIKVMESRRSMGRAHRWEKPKEARWLCAE